MPKSKIKPFYIALFKQEKDGITVHFPDLPGCVTGDTTFLKSYNMAKDALAGWLAVADTCFIPKNPLTKEYALKHVNNRSNSDQYRVVKVPVDKHIIKKYKRKK